MTGTLDPGMLAYVNIIDNDAIQLEAAIVVSDLPASGSGRVRGAKGYAATVECGVMTFHDVVDTETNPGRLVRGPQ
jgi:N-acyl-D-aspartate/D-glutamate deacylase